MRWISQTVIPRIQEHAEYYQTVEPGMLMHELRQQEQPCSPKEASKFAKVYC